MQAVTFGGLLPLDFSAEICRCPTVARKYDPAEHQISEIPIIYVQGARDAQTPKVEAEEHFRGQATEKKVFLEFRRSAHAPLAEQINEHCVGRIKESFFGSARFIRF